MSITSTGLGKAQKRVARVKRVKHIASPPRERLLYPREETAALLGGISVDTLRRLEEKGLLDRVRLTQSPSGKVYHRAKQVHALAKDGGDDDD